MGEVHCSTVSPDDAMPPRRRKNRSVVPASFLWRGSATALFVIALAIVSALGADGQTRPCERDLLVSPENPFGYRLRGDRCEGVYVQKVKATPLVVASFGQLNMPELLTANGTLIVEWPRQTGDVLLLATSLKPRTYYRMDRRQTSDSRLYRWPTDVLAALALKPKDIGIVAWTRQKVGDTLREVYLPIRIGPRPLGRESIYELVLVPGNELREVFVALSSVRADGRRTPLSNPTPLKYGFYPAGRSIRIPVGPVLRPGNYLVEIGATLRGGGAVSHEFWFVQPPVP